MLLIQIGLEELKETATRYSTFTKADNNSLQILQNKLNRLLTGKRRDTPTSELCELTGTLSIQQMIAYYTLTTAYKIISSGKPSFLFSKLRRNQRDTAFLQHRRKGISKESFIPRAIYLLNKIGKDIWNLESEKEFKKEARSWVKSNICIKPKSETKSMRFNQRIKKKSGDDTSNKINPSTGRDQRLITDFFSRN